MPFYDDVWLSHDYAVLGGLSGVLRRRRCLHNQSSGRGEDADSTFWQTIPRVPEDDCDVVSIRLLKKEKVRGRQNPS